MMKIIFAVLSVLTMFIGVDCSGKVMKVSDGWARVTQGETVPAAAYLTIQNRTGQPDRLVSATTYMAATTEIYDTTEKNGIIESHTTFALEIPADKDVVLKPHKAFIALKDLKQPLKNGDKFPITLKFEKAGDVLLEDVVVQTTPPNL